MSTDFIITFLSGGTAGALLVRVVDYFLARKTRAQIERESATPLAASVAVHLGLLRDEIWDEDVILAPNTEISALEPPTLSTEFLDLPAAFAACDPEVFARCIILKESLVEFRQWYSAISEYPTRVASQDLCRQYLQRADSVIRNMSAIAWSLLPHLNRRSRRYLGDELLDENAFVLPDRILRRLGFGVPYLLKRERKRGVV